MNALLTITIADISMSIDNVLAVAAIAREDRTLLIFGLVLAIIFMAFLATIIMKILTKYKWVSWLGLIFLLYLSTEMVIDGQSGFYEIFRKIIISYLGTLTIYINKNEVTFNFYIVNF